MLLSGNDPIAHDPEAVCLDISGFSAATNCTHVRLDLKNHPFDRMELTSIVGYSPRPRLSPRDRQADVGVEDGASF